MAAKKSTRKTVKAASKLAKASPSRGQTKKSGGKKKKGDRGSAKKRLAEAVTTIVEFGMAGDKCTPDNICKHLKEFGKWLDWFDKDYTRLRIAVCNVERLAWNEGTATMGRRFCTEGSGTEPDAPKKPPIWT